MFTKENIPLGYIRRLSKADEESVNIGRVIPFTELRSLVGEKVLNLIFTKNYDGTLIPWYKIVRITDYLVKSDIAYRWSLDKHGYSKTGIKYVCDRVCYTDNDRVKTTNGIVREDWCSNGRFGPVGNTTPYSFYEFTVG